MDFFRNKFGITAYAHKASIFREGLEKAGFQIESEEEIMHEALHMPFTIFTGKKK